MLGVAEGRCGRVCVSGGGEEGWSKSSPSQECQSVSLAVRVAGFERRPAAGAVREPDERGLGLGALALRAARDELLDCKLGQSEWAHR